MFTKLLGLEKYSSDIIKIKARKFLFWFSVMQIFIISAVAYAANNPIELFALISMGISFVAFLAMRSSNYTLMHNMLPIACMGQVALIVAALKGHPYQVDVHMYFFAVLGIITLLLSVSAIFFATVTVALHHLVLYFLIPAYVFSGESSFYRVVIHAVILLLEAGVISWLILLVNSSFNTAAIRAKESEQALDMAKASEAQRIISENKVKEERAKTLKAVAKRFEGSVSVVIKEINDMTKASSAICSQMSVITENAQKNQIRLMC